MVIYLFVALVLFVFAFIQKQHNQKILLFVGVALLFVISAWRGFTVGTDTLNYKLWFDNIESEIRFLTIRGREIFFPYIMFGINYLGLGYRWFVISVATLFSVLVWIICRQSEQSLWVLLLFWLLGYYFQFYNISRQMLAVLITCGAFPLLQKRKIVWWVVLTLVASLFHTSALFAFLLYPLSMAVIANKRMGLIIGLLVVSYLLPFVFNTRGLIYLFENSIFGGDTYEMYYQSTNKGLFSWNRLILNVFFVVLMFLDKNEKKSIYATFIVAYLVILNIFPYSGTLGRIAIYFGCYQLLYLPIVAKQSSVLKTMVAAYSLSVFALFLVTNNCDIIPYVFGED